MQVIQIQLLAELPGKKDFISFFVSNKDPERAKAMYMRLKRPEPAVCYQFRTMFYFPKETPEKKETPEPAQ
jgi:hypothetical protein